jgi:hypothetical protein
LVLDSTILENIPMESNHQLNWNITRSYASDFLLALVCTNMLNSRSSTDCGTAQRDATTNKLVLGEDDA